MNWRSSLRDRISIFLRLQWLPVADIVGVFDGRRGLNKRTSTARVFGVQEERLVPHSGVLPVTSRLGLVPSRPFAGGGGFRRRRRRRRLDGFGLGFGFGFGFGHGRHRRLEEAPQREAARLVGADLQLRRRRVVARRRHFGQRRRRRRIRRRRGAALAADRRRSRRRRRRRRRRRLLEAAVLLQRRVEADEGRAPASRENPFGFESFQ